MQDVHDEALVRLLPARLAPAGQAAREALVKPIGDVHVYVNGLCWCATHQDRRWWLTQVLMPRMGNGKRRYRGGAYKGAKA